MPLVKYGNLLISNWILQKKKFVKDLLDIRLAGKMDGIEAVTKIKSESDKVIQFIFTTGYSDIELKEQAKKLNPAGFFVKPVNVPELVNTIKLFFSEQNKLAQVNE